MCQMLLEALAAYTKPLNPDPKHDTVERTLPHGTEGNRGTRLKQRRSLSAGTRQGRDANPGLWSHPGAAVSRSYHGKRTGGPSRRSTHGGRARGCGRPQDSAASCFFLRRKMGPGQPVTRLRQTPWWARVYPNENTMGAGPARPQHPGRPRYSAPPPRACFSPGREPSLISPRLPAKRQRSAEEPARSCSAAAPGSRAESGRAVPRSVCLTHLSLGVGPGGNTVQMPAPAPQPVRATPAPFAPEVGRFRLDAS